MAPSMLCHRQAIPSIIIILRSTASGEWGHVPVEGEVARGSKLKSLSLFLQTVRKTILVHSQVRSNPFENAELDGLRYSEIWYRYGTSAAPTA
jgi:hypothetical protein